LLLLAAAAAAAPPPPPGSSSWLLLLLLLCLVPLSVQSQHACSVDASKCQLIGTQDKLSHWISIDGFV
jgi:hypothetical protein